ncbi:glyoxalase superfamily protein [Gordonia soli]|uniref:Bleomycin resistance protein n=1 Tax=Gordonia soli NBRC 108243 TaxID=1223545 RepID=M0QMZ5_9ACTN|nr:glyoxalase superfamily protein [Gordonia soli]GAC69784.1 hypothetical protein GS4_28_00320 [Gordonia soli NBRC 108243]
MTPQREVPPAVVPILRVFPGDEADRFYLDYLGFVVDWEHRFEPDLPLYRQVSRGDWALHLSEHHGDATPGSAVRLRIADLDAFHREIRAKDYPLRPGIETMPWAREVRLTDPFGNRLVFHTPTEA